MPKLTFQSNSKFFSLVLSVVLAGATSAGWAQSTYSDMSNQLDAEIQIYQKQEQLNNAKQRLVDPRLTSLPQVVAVLGLEGNLKAKLMLSSGVTLLYGEGESINPNMKVAAITTREVVVAVTGVKSAKKNKPLLAPLAFLSGAQLQKSQSGMPAMGGSPQMPIPESLLPPLPMQLAPMDSRSGAGVGQRAPAVPTGPQMASPAAQGPAGIPAAAPVQAPPVSAPAAAN